MDRSITPVLGLEAVDFKLEVRLDTTEMPHLKTSKQKNPTNEWIVSGWVDSVAQCCNTPSS